ncbi:MAG: hypothetical protein HZB33_05745 [Nitrospirae bacterium]|nr:hypothetical protein [Nitrospirota bacterium]
MILHPGILALLTGGLITLLLILAAAALGSRVLLKWDIGSSSEQQLSLERRTYLVSTLVQYGLLFEALSFFLFIYTADDLHNLLTGAMCATGSLNANPYGFPALYAKLTLLFGGAAWIGLNYLDNRAEDYPLTRKKYLYLLFLAPVVIISGALQTLYFMDLDPNVITSCCGTLFSEGGQGISSSLASLPVKTMRVLFFSLFLFLLATGLSALKTGWRPVIYLHSFTSGLFLVTAVASVISFISLYYYQIPTHHCPFDLLQSGYYHVGYPLYAALFTGGFFGVMASVIDPFRKTPSLAGIVPEIERRWIVISLYAFTFFVILSSIPMIFTSFTLEGH